MINQHDEHHLPLRGIYRLRDIQVFECVESDLTWFGFFIFRLFFSLIRRRKWFIRSIQTYVSPL